MRKIYGSVIACSIALGLGIGTLCPKPAAAEKLRFVADWVLGGKHAPFLLARDKGYWKKAGLDISINRGFGSGSSSKILAAGKADFSFIDLGTLILHRTRPCCLSPPSRDTATFRERGSCTRQVQIPLRLPKPVETQQAPCLSAPAR